MSTTPHPEQPQGPHTPPFAGHQPTGQPHAGQPYPGQAPGPAYPQGVALEPSQQRTFGMLSHLIPLLAMVLSAGVLGFIGSLVVYVLYKDRGDFVRRHAATSLNTQIMPGILLLLSSPLLFALGGSLPCGPPLVIPFFLPIIGAMKPNSGEMWDPPLTPRFVK